MNITKTVGYLVFFAGLAFIYAPILSMIIFSFSTNQDSVSIANLSFTWYKVLFENEEMISSLINSLLVATLCTAFSVFAATIFVVANKVLKLPLIQESFSFNISIPEIFLAISVIIIFSMFKMELGLTAVLIGHILLGLGLAVPAIYVANNNIEKSLMDASIDLGANNFQTFSRVTLPIMSPILFSVGFLIFSCSLDDFFINFFCSGIDFKTVSTYVYTSIKSSINPSINALSSIMLIVSLAFVVLFNFLKKVINRHE